jgi:hypothetical protein
MRGSDASFRMTRLVVAEPCHVMSCNVMPYVDKSATAGLARELALLEADVSLRLTAASPRVRAAQEKRRNA